MLYAKPLAKVVEATLTWETRGSQKQKEKLLSHVFVLDANKQPLEPVYPGRARFLLTQGKAAVYRRSPFTIILKAAVSSPRVQELRVKIDPGSKTTGLAIVIDVSGKVVWAAQITYRGGMPSSKRWIDAEPCAGTAGSARRGTGSHVLRIEDVAMDGFRLPWKAGWRLSRPGYGGSRNWPR